MDQETYLQHYGVLGMKWGVRKARRSANAHEDYKKAHSKKPVSEMSDAELKARNKRLEAERQYKSLTKKTNKGKAAAQAFITTAATITGVIGAYATYKKLGHQALNTIGDWVVKDLKITNVH